jgi:hypothetical protein
MPECPRPDKREAEMLSEEDLKELRYNLAHLSLPDVREFLREGLPGLSPHLRSWPNAFFISSARY